MIHAAKPLTLFYFFSGLLVGLLVGVSVEKEWSDLISRSISVGMVILLGLSWRRIEAVLHRRYADAWSSYRAGGKWRFIVAQYIVIRGTVLIVAIAGPALHMLRFTPATAAVLLVCVVTVGLLLTYLGHDAWTSCEREYEILMLRQAAEQSRAAVN